MELGRARGRGAPTDGRIESSRADHHNVIEPSRQTPDKLLQASLHHMRASQHARGQARTQLGAWKGRGEGCTHRRQRSNISGKPSQCHRTKSPDPRHARTSFLASYASFSARARTSPNSTWSLGGQGGGVHTQTAVEQHLAQTITMSSNQVATPQTRDRKSVV